MILQGNQRGGGTNLAQHLLKAENDHVEIFDLRGFVSDDLYGAFKEAYAASRATKAKQFLFSLSLNPPPTEKVPTEVFEETIARVEHALGLTKQPRAIVFHEKEGRRHAHAVWSRIDTKQGKAVQLSFTKRKLMDISRELFLEHRWKMPKGLMRSDLRDPRNFTLAQWQQAKRAKKDPKAIKAAFQECWSVSDTQAALANALNERGYILAKGDRRGVVAVDFKGEVYALAKWAGVKTKEVLSKIDDSESLPSVDEARRDQAKTLLERLVNLQDAQEATIQARANALNVQRASLTKMHKTARAALLDQQAHRWQTEFRERQGRFSSGLRGLMQRVSGKRRQIEGENEREAYLANRRDQFERDGLIFEQLETSRKLQSRIDRLFGYQRNFQRSLREEREQFEEMARGKRESFELAPRKPRAPYPQR